MNLIIMRDKYIIPSFIIWEPKNILKKYNSKGNAIENLASFDHENDN